MEPQWIDKIFSVQNDGFESLALGIFRFQFENNPVYQAYVNALNVDPGAVNSLEAIPFLPVRFFQNNEVKTGAFEPKLMFESSGTTGSVPSRHLIREPLVYEKSFTKAFEKFYGSATDYCILGLLPAYLERSHSSLVYMVDRLIQRSAHPLSGFYLNEYDSLLQVLQELKKKKQKTLLIGVTFALLDLAEIMNEKQGPMNFDNLLLMETGGMKGRRTEMIRKEVHDILKNSFGVAQIHSEYGMTEALSQSYSNKDGIFVSPAWMKILLRDEEDPISVKPLATEKITEGIINIIDLANIYSCSFLATDDIGKRYPDGRFEVLGRRDGSDLRGCSLMVV